MSDRFPPGPDHNVLQAVRSTLRQQRSRLQFLLDMARDYDDICHFHTGFRNIYLVTNPAYVHQVLVEQADKFHRTAPAKRSFGKYLGQGLLVLDGELHRRERRLVQPAFHHQRIDAYADVMVRYTQRLIAGWQAGQEREISTEMTRLTSEIVAQCLFGADVSGEAKAIAWAMGILQDASIRQLLLLGTQYTRLMNLLKQQEQQALRTMDRIIYGFIKQRRESGQDTGDLLSMLLLATDEAGNLNSTQQVRDEVITLFLAGHETTSNTLTWAWYLLSQNPDAAVRLRQEIRDVLGDRAPTVQDMPCLEYSTMIIRETLRLYPPAWIIPRQAIADVEIGGYCIRAGSVVIPSPYITHRRAAYFPEPELFRPERFSPGYEQVLPRFAYFPFGGGPHFCMGQSFAMLESVLILTVIAQQHTLTLARDQRVELEPLVTLRAKYGMRMIVNKV